jgi:hypothetical protein
MGPRSAESQRKRVPQESSFRIECAGLEMPFDDDLERKATSLTL